MQSIQSSLCNVQSLASLLIVFDCRVGPLQKRAHLQVRRNNHEAAEHLFATIRGMSCLLLYHPEIEVNASQEEEEGLMFTYLDESLLCL